MRSVGRGNYTASRDIPKAGCTAKDGEIKNE